jgi:beta-glucanase (GH16 family)
MTRRLPLLVVLAAAVGCSGSTEPKDYQVVWEDEFIGAAGSIPDPAHWAYDVDEDWGNAQLEYDTDRPINAALDGAGRLVITARQEAFMGRAYTSARLKTAALREFQYGRFEARIQLPTGQGLWPAFWLLGSDVATVGWPQSGEIDIMEYRGQEPSVAHGTVHGPGYSGGNAITRQYTLPSGRFDTGFHVFRMDWSATLIRFYVDDKLYHEVRKGDQPGAWVFDHPFYIILNVAVGGNYVGAPNASTTFPQQMIVDWVRVSQVAP